MGCCLSSGSKSSPPPASASHPPSKNGNRYDFEPHKFLKSTAEARAPPPDCGEETVKEVLSSETPNPNPPRRPPQQKEQHYSAIPPADSPPNPAPVNPEPEERIVVEEKKEIRAPAVEKLVEEEEISEQDASEVCSVSVSVSISESAMSTATTANDEEVTMKQLKGSRRSPAGKMSAARMNRAFSTADSGGPRKEQRVVGRSPTRRSDRSPAKKNYSAGGGAGQVRMGYQSRESGPNPAARRPLRPDPSRRETGDSSARRSRSPATHRSTAGTGAGSRNGSVKRTNQSPGRVRKDPPEISASDAAANPGNVDPATHHHRGNNDDKEDATAANESLENPLVSLECFIFL